MKVRQAKKKYNELYLEYAFKCRQIVVMRKEIAILEAKIIDLHSQINWEKTLSEMAEKRRSDLMTSYLELAEQKRKLEERPWWKKVLNV